MSELPPEPERPQELTEPVLLESVIREMVVGDAFDGSQEENEAARKLSADIADVQSEIVALWETRKEPDTSYKDINVINRRLLDARARLVQLELPKDPIEP